MQCTGLMPNAFTACANSSPCSKVARCRAPLSPISFPPSPSHNRELLVCRASERAHTPSTPIWLLPSPSQRSVLLTCSPSARLCAPEAPILFCQRDKPSSLKFSLRQSPRSRALSSVKPLLPSSRVMRVRLRQRATAKDDKRSLGN